MRVSVVNRIASRAFRDKNNNNKADSFFRLNFNVYIDVDNAEKELERETKNTGDQFRWKKNMKIL